MSSKDVPLGVLPSDPVPTDMPMHPRARYRRAPRKGHASHELQRLQASTLNALGKGRRAYSLRASERRGLRLLRPISSFVVPAAS